MEEGSQKQRLPTSEGVLKSETWHRSWWVVLVFPQGEASRDSPVSSPSPTHTSETAIRLEHQLADTWTKLCSKLAFGCRHCAQM